MTNLIAIDDLIQTAAARGVNFERVNPRVRLAYLTKLGLIPNAVKKKVDGKLVGHYPLSVLDTLDQIEKSKAGGLAYRDIRPAQSPLTNHQPPVNFPTLAAALFAGIIIGILVGRFILFGPVQQSSQTSLLVPISQAGYKGSAENLMKVIKFGELQLPE